MNHGYHYTFLFSLRAVSFPFPWGVNTHTNWTWFHSPHWTHGRIREVTRPRWPPGTQSKTSKAQQSMDLVQHWRPRPMVQWWLCRHAYTQYLTITKCTLLHQTFGNIFRNRQRRSVLLICVFTIIFPSANQLHCIYLTMISMNAEYNFPPNVKRDMFFPV